MSKREKEILRLIFLSLTKAEDIGKYLNVSTHTVSNHVKHLLTKTKTDNKTELLALFLQHCFKIE